MKRIFTLSAITLFTAILLNSCVKNGYYSGDNSYWLSKERGQVVYSSSTCNYYVVETNYGYSIIRSYGAYRPYERDVLYGDFGFYGTRQIYNWTSDNVFTGTVTDYRLSYIEAQDALNYYCPYGKGQREFLKADALTK
jgi:hypothetical protein